MIVIQKVLTHTVLLVTNSQGVSQVGNFFETFTTARVATFAALQAIARKPGAPREEIYEDPEEEEEDENKDTSKKAADASSSNNDKNAEADVETGERKLKAILPEYVIDSQSTAGEKPEDVKGQISFKNVNFTYPTRPNNPVLLGLDLEIEAGKTTALVGPSGGGKSTTVSLIERFYDPISGSIELDGLDLRKINVSHLRQTIGYVGQEPTLFATTIAGNIRYGNPNATQEEVSYFFIANIRKNGQSLESSPPSPNACFYRSKQQPSPPTRTISSPLSLTGTTHKSATREASYPAGRSNVSRKYSM